MIHSTDLVFSYRIQLNIQHITSCSELKRIAGCGFPSGFFFIKLLCTQLLKNEGQHLVVSCRKLLSIRSCGAIMCKWNPQVRNVELFELDAISLPDDKVIRFEETCCQRWYCPMDIFSVVWRNLLPAMERSLQLTDLRNKDDLYP